MRGLNRVILSGNVGGSILFKETDKGTPACSFSLASDRHSDGQIVTTWVKINAFGPGLVDVCKTNIEKGVYVLVEGELMNREGKLGMLTEVRLHNIVFLDRKSQPLKQPPQE
jgi:single stranded DNA-binding protein